MYQPDNQDWDAFITWALSTEQKEFEAQVKEYEREHKNH
jgi:hypothetical protein